MRGGLDTILPRRNVFAEVAGGWSALGGPLVRAEAGARVGSNAAVFAFGQVDEHDKQAGVGARVTW